METREFRVLHKRGEPFLYLPKMRVAARNALNLYPAQRTLARLARTAMNFSLCFGLPLPRTKVPLATNAPFAKFLKKLTHSGIMPEFSVLAGNPSAPGRRFIFLVFDSNGTPRWVVKAGTEDSAAALIEREADFLQRLPTDLSGAPRVAARFVDGSAKAFAMDYADGDSPRDPEDGRIERTLSSWVDDSRELCPAELPVWRQLVDSDADPDLVAHLTTLLRNRTVHPVIAHGDFTPWNIKESYKAKGWVVLDWERGERDGMRRQPLRRRSLFEHDLRAQPSLAQRHERVLERLRRFLGHRHDRRVRGPVGPPTARRASNRSSGSCCLRASRRSSRPSYSPSRSAGRNISTPS